MDLSKFENNNGFYFNDEMIESWDGLKLNLVRQFISDSPKAILIILHGLANNLTNFGYLPRPEFVDSHINVIDAAYGTLHLTEWKTMKEFSKQGDTSTLSEISPAILNAFKEGIAYLKTHRDTFCNSVMILNGNADDSVSPKDAIEFYEQTVAKDKSLFIYAG